MLRSFLSDLISCNFFLDHVLITFFNVDEAIEREIRVPLHFVNQEKSPAGKIGGAFIMHELNQVVVACLPKDLPEHLEVDLSELNIGDVIHISDIKLPEGVSIPSLRLGKLHNLPVVLAKPPLVEEVVAVAAPTKGGKPVGKSVPAAAQKQDGKAPAAKAAAKAAPKKK